MIDYILISCVIWIAGSFSLGLLSEVQYYRQNRLIKDLQSLLKTPRPLSQVRFKFENRPQDQWENLGQIFEADCPYLYLGKCPNWEGHAWICDLSKGGNFKCLGMWDIEDFEEIEPLSFPASEIDE